MTMTPPTERNSSYPPCAVEEPIVGDVVCTSPTSSSRGGTGGGGDVGRRSFGGGEAWGWGLDVEGLACEIGRRSKAAVYIIPPAGPAPAIRVLVLVLVFWASLGYSTLLGVARLWDSWYGTWGRIGAGERWPACTWRGGRRSGCRAVERQRDEGPHVAHEQPVDLRRARQRKNGQIAEQIPRMVDPLGQFAEVVWRE